MSNYTYILTNKNKTVLYVGATRNLKTRMTQHKTKYYPKSFSAQYNCYNLMYYELFETYNEALAREKQLKSGNRKRKISLIESKNPDWLDLASSYASLGGEDYLIKEIW